MSADVVMRDVIVVGGGCYGTFYARQLATAKERQKARFRQVIVVDRNPACQARLALGEAPDRRFVIADWTAYFAQFLAQAEPRAPGEAEDFIVPSPLMPHLMFQWVLARARQRWPGRPITVAPVPGTFETPYDRRGSDHTRYVSFADWICPTHCIEPAVCPALGSARTWEMGSAVERLAERLREAGDPIAGVAVFVCRHHVFGVGTFSVAAVHAGDALVETAGASGAPAAVLVATVSACHGAVNLLRLGGVAGERAGAEAPPGAAARVAGR